MPEKVPEVGAAMSRVPPPVGAWVYDPPLSAENTNVSPEPLARCTSSVPTRPPDTTDLVVRLELQVGLRQTTRQEYFHRLTSKIRSNAPGTSIELSTSKHARSGWQVAPSSFEQQIATYVGLIQARRGANPMRSTQQGRSGTSGRLTPSRGSPRA